MGRHFNLQKRDARVKDLWLMDGLAPRDICAQLIAEGFPGFTGKKPKRAMQIVYESLARIRENFAPGDPNPEDEDDRTIKITEEERARYRARLQYLWDVSHTEIEKQDDEVVIQTGHVGSDRPNTVQRRKGPNTRRVRAMQVALEVARAIAALGGVKVDPTEGEDQDRDERPIGVVVIPFDEDEPKQDENGYSDETAN